MTAIDRSPTLFGSTLALVVAVGSVAVVGLYSWFALVLGTGGLLVFAGGLVTGRQAPVTAGAGGLFLGVIFAGIAGVPELAVLVSATGTILAWDIASTALDLGKQLGRDAPTVRLEGVRVATNAVVGGVAVGVIYGLYSAIAGDASFTAVVLVLLGAVLIVMTLR